MRVRAQRGDCALVQHRREQVRHARLADKNGYDQINHHHGRHAEGDVQHQRSRHIGAFQAFVRAEVLQPPHAKGEWHNEHDVRQMAGEKTAFADDVAGGGAGDSGKEGSDRRQDAASEQHIQRVFAGRADETGFAERNNAAKRRDRSQ